MSISRIFLTTKKCPIADVDEKKKLCHNFSDDPIEFHHVVNKRLVLKPLLEVLPVLIGRSHRKSKGQLPALLLMKFFYISMHEAQFDNKKCCENNSYYQHIQAALLF